MDHNNLFNKISYPISILILTIVLFLAGCTSKIDQAKELIAEHKSEDAISLLSKIESDSKDFSEAQKLIKIENSKILYNKGLDKYFSGNYKEALEYFTKIEDDGTLFSNLKQNINEAQIGLDLIMNLPGIYEGNSNNYFAGGYMLTMGKIEIFKSLGYNIYIQNTDTYNYGFHKDLYTGTMNPQVTKFDSGIYGLILNLHSAGNSYGESAYFYKYDSYWVIQFNMKSTTNQSWTLKLVRKGKKNNTVAKEENKNLTRSNTEINKDDRPQKSTAQISDDEFYENLDVQPRRLDNKIFKFQCEFEKSDYNNKSELNLELYIDRNGNVVDAGILSVNQGCMPNEKMVIQQLEKYLKFEPGILGNKKVPCRIEYKLTVNTF